MKKILAAVGFTAAFLYLLTEGLNLTVAPGELLTNLSQFLGVIVFLTLIPDLAIWAFSGRKI